MKKFNTKKSLYTLIIIAFVLVTGITLVQGSWSEPTGAPTTGNVNAPLTVGAANQTKQGTISARDVFSSDAVAWMSQIMKLKLYSLDGASGWPNGYRILSSPTQLTGQAIFPWTISTPNGSYNTTPLNVPVSHIKALLVRARCGEVEMFLGVGALNTNPTSAQRVCAAEDNQNDTNDVIVPIYTTGGTSDFRFNYVMNLLDAPSYTGFIDVLGIYYQ